MRQPGSGVGLGGGALEYQHRSRNAAAYLMKSFGNFHNDVEAVLLTISIIARCA